MQTDKAIQKAARILAGSTRAVASCGAGISAESGIATFRDAGGIWDRLDPYEAGTTQGLLNTLSRNPAKLLPLLTELLDAFEQARPNAAHLALGELEQMGILQTVVTQNIDNLHQEGGNTDVIEVHGNGFRLLCLSCGSLQVRERRSLIQETKARLNSLAAFDPAALATLMPPCTACSSITRPDVVMFGEAVKEIPRAYVVAAECDVMLAIGTSGVVYPAAYLPYEAKKAGAKVIVVNPHENAFGGIADVYIEMKAGEAMPRLVQAVRELREG